MTTTAPRRVRLDSWARIDAWVEQRVLDRRPGARRELEVADALRIVAAATRTGASLPQALARVEARRADRVGAAFGRAAARIALGRSVDDEVRQLARELRSPAAELFATVVIVQHRRGGDLSGPCQRLAALLHDRARVDAEARSATAQARFSARAVLAIPLLLAAAAAWRAPDQVAAFLRPSTALLALPGVAFIVAGAMVAHRVASRATDIGARGAVSVTPDGRVRRVLARAAGDGPRSLRSVRLGGVSLACAVALIAARPGVGMVACAGVLVAAAVAWPWSDAVRRRRERATIAQSGIESLLEVSIALFAAGATAHEVATLAPASCEEPLRSALAPAVHRVGLGRTVASAYAAVPEVAASPQLDAWLHAICTSAELGAPAGTVLEQLLRDARAARREQLRSAAQTAGPRMQLALVLLVVPGIMYLMLLATVGGLLGQLRASGVL